MAFGTVALNKSSHRTGVPVDELNRYPTNSKSLKEKTRGFILPIVINKIQLLLTPPTTFLKKVAQKF